MSFLRFCAMIVLSSGCIQSVPRDLYRTNFGVFLEDVGFIRTSSQYWYHHFKIDLPNIEKFDLLPCLKSLDEASRDPGSPCYTYEKYGRSGIITNAVRKLNKDIASALNSLQDVVKSSLKKLPTGYRRRRSAPLEFIGGLSKTIFGEATEDDVNRVAKSVNEIIKEGNVMRETLERQQKNFESFLSVTNSRYGNMSQIVRNNHLAFRNLEREEDNMWDNTVRMFEEYGIRRNLRNQTEHFLKAIESLKYSISILGSKSYISPDLLNDTVIQNTVRDIKDILEKKKHPHSVRFSSAVAFRRSGSFVAYWHNSSIWITLKFEIAPTENMQLYRTHVFRVPVHRHSTDTTIMKGLPDYIATNNLREGGLFVGIGYEELQLCHGKINRFCPFNLAYENLNSKTCLSALLKDEADEINNLCKISLTPNSFIRGFEVLRDSKLIVYGVPEFTFICQGEDSPVPGCDFCIMDAPCGCTIIFGRQRAYTLLKPSCLGNNPHTVTREHLVNVAYVKSFVKDAVRSSISASKRFKNSQEFDSPKYNLFKNNISDLLIGDLKDEHDLKKIVRNIEENKRTFHSLSEAVLDNDITFSNVVTADDLFIWIIIALVTAVLLLLWQYPRYRLIMYYLSPVLIGSANATEDIPKIYSGMRQVLPTSRPLDENVIPPTKCNQNLFVTAGSAVCILFITLMAFRYVYSVLKSRMNKDKCTIYMTIISPDMTRKIDVKIISMPLVAEAYRIVPGYRKPVFEITGSIFPYLKVEWHGLKYADRLNQNQSHFETYLSINWYDQYKLKRFFLRGNSEILLTVTSGDLFSTWLTYKNENRAGMLDRNFAIENFSIDIPDDEIRDADSQVGNEVIYCNNLC